MATALLYDSVSTPAQFFEPGIGWEESIAGEGANSIIWPESLLLPANAGLAQQRAASEVQVVQIESTSALSPLAFNYNFRANDFFDSGRANRLASNACPHCRRLEVCDCGSPDRDRNPPVPQHLKDLQDAAQPLGLPSWNLHPARIRPEAYETYNEARSSQLQEMESSNEADTLTLQPAALPENPYTNGESSGMTRQVPSEGTTDAVGEEGHVVNDLYEIPQHRDVMLPQTDYTKASNEHADVAQSVANSQTEVELAANILPLLANGNVNVSTEVEQNHIPFDQLTQQQLLDRIANNCNRMDQLYGEMAEEAEHGEEADFNVDPQNAKAYAKLVFADGDYFVTTHDLTLGRNMDAFTQLRRKRKQEKRAKEAVDLYRQEPSQPSQPGDEDQQRNASSSSQSLEGRPAPPSNFSEHGGPVWFAPENGGEAERRRRSKRRSQQFSKSSSTTSVTPANLHPPNMSQSRYPSLFDADGEPTYRTTSFLPLHTPVPEDISKISKEHLLFSYDFADERWKLHVLGNRAFINQEIFDRDTVVPLEHNDEILIASVNMVFKLPDNFRRSPGLSHGTFSRDTDTEDEDIESDEQDLGTSPARRLSNAVGVDESDADEDEQAQNKAGRKKPKLKLKVKPDKTKAKKDKGKGKEKPEKKKKASPLELSPEAGKKLDKGKKPKAADKEPAGDVSPPEPPKINPGSILEGIPLEELPEKRKGPGRPPKEGNVSKRDTALANRKRKEYERKGEEPPSFKQLVDEVRKENKIKEYVAKLGANGELPAGTQVMQSIETNAASASRPPAAVKAEEGDHAGGTSTEPAKRASPKPKRTAKSPSPMKPESEYTEEDLKKPTGTYVHILDEILREHPDGRADLQELYDRIMKRYPYYKYGVSTSGWQSSVRHNLLQHDRFRENGKSGKGKLWSINFETPLEREKKRRATPPPRPPQMQNGQYMPGQMQQGQYGNPYGHPTNFGRNGPQHASGGYYSPYGQAGPGRPPIGLPQQFPHSQQQQPPSQQQPNGVNPVAQPQDPVFTSLVTEVMAVRQVLLQPYLGTDRLDEYQAIFSTVTTLLSDRHKNKQSYEGIKETLPSDEHKRVFDQICAVFKKHEQISAQKGDDDGSGGHGEGRKAVDTAGQVDGAVQVNGNVTDGAAESSAPDANDDNAVAATPVTQPSDIAARALTESGVTSVQQALDTEAGKETASTSDITAPAISGTKRAAVDDGEHTENKRVKTIKS